MNGEEIIKAEAAMIAHLKAACDIAEYLSNWDKSPQKEWYYSAKNHIKLNTKEL